MKKTAMGAVWRLWDFHAHTPASYLWDGAKLRGMANKEREALLEQSVRALREAEPDVYVIMDYWTFDGYRAIRDYVAKNPGTLGEKLIFPGIELRIESSLKNERLNVHLILDPRVEDQVFNDVLAELKIELRDGGERGLSEQCFIQYARELGVDKLAKHHFDATQVQSDADYALKVGWQTAEVKPDSLRRVLENTLKDKGLLLQPWDTYGGMRGIDFAQHYNEVRRLMRVADVFECKDAGCRAAFHGQKLEENKEYFDNFWKAIGQTPRLCVRGTDAHSFTKYGQFPSGMKTWLKAEPTFRGLLQAIREPFFRSHIGNIPPKKAFVEENGRLFMTRLQIQRRPAASVSEKWFDGVDLELNPDLVAIVGNKGSGKSGLAEVLALAGNAKAKGYFTFLNDKRFLSGAVPRADAFEAQLSWQNGDILSATLANDPKETEPERVKYISQIYFEELCNEHIAGNSDRFGSEIRKVLFTNMDPAERLDFQTLDDYLKAKETPAENRIAAHRTRLADLNHQILELEKQASPTYTNELKDKLADKELALRDLDSKKPQEVVAPANAASPHAPNTEQVRLGEIAVQLESLSNTLNENDQSRKHLTERRNALTLVTERLQLFQQQASALDTELRATLVKVGIDVGAIVSVSTKLSELTKLQVGDQAQTERLSANQLHIMQQQSVLIEERTKLQETLDAPNKAFQEYLVAKKTWDETRTQLVGTADDSDTIEHYKALLRALDQIPKRREDIEQQQEQALRNIHAELSAIAEARKALFVPVERVIEQVPAIKEDLKVAFQSNLFFNRRAFTDEFFQLVKQNTGGFRGEEDGQVRLNEFIKKTDFTSAKSVIDLMRVIRSTLTSSSGGALPVQQVMRAGKSSEQLYELLFGLRHLEAKFSLSLAGTAIQQMSPGQRGALLLIFYLLVDSDQIPLILDQPEENLDNQTVYSMLVPIIQRAKNRRQIVMVTHNANLAVCCDAEQIIHAEFDRANNFALSYQTGAIEEALTNRLVVDVLEGTSPAFGNRRDKYFSEAK